MNLRHVGYALGHLRGISIDMISIGSSIMAGYSVSNILAHTSNELLQNITDIGWIYFGILGVKLEFRRIAEYTLFMMDRKNSKIIESENVDDIFIEDKSGLEFLLSKTSENYKREWCTVMESTTEHNAIHITKILNDGELSNIGFTQKHNFLSVESSNSIVRTYSGFHHYHPSHLSRYLAGLNFYVYMDDRYSSVLGQIQLLSFNMDYRPELIAFNKRFIYIPIDRNDKRILRKASRKDIVKYLE